MQFKALQTYSDGDVVRWIEDTPAGGAEPEHPAPALTLTKADSTAPTSSSGSDDSTARTLGIVGIVAGVLGLAIGGVAFFTSRHKPSAT